MARLSVRRSAPSKDLLYTMAGLGIGFLSGFLVRGLAGRVDRRRLRHLVTGLTGERPVRPSAGQAAGRIRAALEADTSLHDLDVKVVPVGPGRVEVHGWAPDRRVRARAQRVAAAAAADVEVTNRFRVRGEDDLAPPAEPKRHPA